MILKTVMSVTILITAGTATGSLPEGINVIPAPLIISDSLAFSLEEGDPVSDELFDRLGLIEIPSAGDHFTHYLPGEVEIEGTPILLLFFQSYTEEIFGWLISYSDDGCVIDWICLYYWNSEGFGSRTGSIDTDGTVIVIEWPDVWEDNPIADTLSVREDGFFGVTGNAGD